MRFIKLKEVPGVPVIIYWLDTNCSVDEYTKEEKKKKKCPAYSIGFLVDQDEDHYTICWDFYARDKEWQGYQHVPKGMVKEMIKLVNGGLYRPKGGK